VYIINPAMKILRIIYLSADFRSIDKSVSDSWKAITPLTAAWVSMTGKKMAISELFGFLSERFKFWKSDSPRSAWLNTLFVAV